MLRDQLSDSHASRAALAQSLGISRQSLYYHPLRPEKDELLRQSIIHTLHDHPAYGYRRVAIHLNINKKRAHRVMKKYTLKARLIRKQRYGGSITKLSAIPNRLPEIQVTQPNTIWVGDFTCLWHKSRYLYLATVMDYHTREIIGWQIGIHHTTTLVLDTLKEAFRKRGTTPTLFHSDQGSEYTAARCLGWLIRHKITPSNSPRGKPWVNGRQESFFSSFKFEFGKPSRFTTVEDLIEGIGRHIHYYNTLRVHSALKMPPHAFCLKCMETQIHPKEP